MLSHGIRRLSCSDLPFQFAVPKAHSCTHNTPPNNSSLLQPVLYMCGCVCTCPPGLWAVSRTRRPFLITRPRVPPRPLVYVRVPQQRRSFTHKFNSGFFLLLDNFFVASFFLCASAEVIAFQNNCPLRLK